MVSEKEGLVTDNLLYDNGIIWLTGSADNKLYTYDVNSRKTTLFYTFEEEKKDGEWLFRTIAKKDKLLFLIPFSASALYIIDILTKEVRKREITVPGQSAYQDYYPTKKFSAFAWYGNSIFLIGTTCPAIVQYDYEKDTVTCITEWFGEIRKRFTDNRDFIFKKICVDGKHFFAPCCRCNCVLEFDMEALEYEVHDLDTDVGGFISICKQKDRFWLIPRADERVVCWDGREGKCEEYVFEKNESGCMNFYSDLLAADEEHMILLGGRAKDTLLLNTEKRTAEQISKRLYGLGPLSYVGGDKSVFYVFSTYFKLLVRVEDGKVCFRKIYPPQCGEAPKMCTASLIQRESAVNTLEELLDEISDSGKDAAGREEKRTYGERIWNYIKTRG